MMPPNLSLNADVPHAWLAPTAGPPVSFRSLGMAGRLLALFVAVVASGCVFVTENVYVPANAADTVRGRGCVPYAYFKREIADGVTLRVDFHWWEHRSPSLEIRGFLESGKSIQFLENRVSISSASDISVAEFRELLVPGLGYPGMSAPIDRFAPTEQLVGVDFVALTRQSSVNGITDRTEPIVVSLPRIIANGTYIEVAPITFKPEPHSAFCPLSA